MTGWESWMYLTKLNERQFHRASLNLWIRIKPRHIFQKKSVRMLLLFSLKGDYGVTHPVTHFIRTLSGINIARANINTYTHKPGTLGKLVQSIALFVITRFDVFPNKF